MRPRHILALALAVVASQALAPLAAAAPKPREPFFPGAGNAGYNARHYKVRLSYRPARRWLQAKTTIEARSTSELHRVSLDLRGLTVDWATVDGAPARFRRGRNKLRITPPQTIPRRTDFTVVVRYHGSPRRVVDQDGSSEGWVATGDGALAVGEPQGTMAWIPCDNVPADKASFDISVNVPEGLRAISNGTLVRVKQGQNRRRVYYWSEPQQMSTYLAVVDIGRGRLVEDEVDGLPYWTLVDPHLVAASAPVLAKLPEVIRFESHAFGPYPFGSAGSIVDVEPKLGYALETQTRPIYAFAPDISTLVHETAHQWFGDAVGLKRWPNIWLNEGFATWTQWYYAERHRGRSARQIFRKLYRVPASDTAFWEPPSAHPGLPKNLFGTSTYVRGAMALEALRVRIGSGAFLRLLRTWVADHRYGSADIEQFIALAEEVSGRNLGRLFRDWLFARGKPRGYGYI